MHQRTWLSILTLPLVAGFTYPMLAPQRSQAPKIESKAANQDPLAGITDIRDVLSYVRDNYVDPVDMDKVISGGIQAALERAHGLNAYLTPEELRLPDPGPAETGMRVVRRGLYALVLSVLPDSPAAKAGVLAGDGLRKVDGDSVGIMTQPALERRLKGAPGSSVSFLRFSVATGETKTLTLTRAILPKPQVGVRHEGGCTVVSLPDLSAGRVQELRAAMQSGDPAAHPILIDLRRCHGGTLDEAGKLAAALGLKGKLLTLQEQGKPDREIQIPEGTPIPGARFGVLVGTGTAGPAELVASAIKKAKLPTLGDRTAALGLSTTRIPLRSGGAVELVHQRWVASGGERLDRAVVVPETPLRGLRPEDDPVPRAIELFLKNTTATKATRLTPPPPSTEVG